jgi:hypothetical protein
VVQHLKHGATGLNHLIGRQTFAQQVIPCNGAVGQIEVCRVVDDAAVGLRRAALPAFGIILDIDEPPFPPLLKLVADQLKVSIESWDKTKGSGLATCVHARPDPASRYDLIAHSR